MTGPEFRAARVALGLSQLKLAAAMEMSSNTIRAIEETRGPIRAHYALAMKALAEDVQLSWRAAIRPG